MTNPMTFESHLSAALAEYADLAPIEIDARAMARGFASRELERPAASRWKGLRLRRGRMLVLVIVALLAAILALAVGARLVHPPTLLYGSFQSTGQLPPVAGMRRYVNAAAMLRDGRALVVGSFDSYRTGTETWAYLYDPASGSFASTGTVSEIRGLSTATTLADGRVLVVGGYHVDEEGLPIEPKYGELFDPRTGTFARTPGQMSTGRYGHTATLLADGRVLITGGAVFDFGNPSIYLAEAEVFDPDTGRFDVVGPMSESRVYHQATRLRDGRVLISGGAATDDTVATAAAELFDPATGRFSPTGSMATPRFWHAAATLADGRVLVAGGATSGSRPGVLPALASAELYDPGTGVFTTTHALATERMQPTATRLPDGRVFVAGGKNDFGGPRTAELFDPTTGLFLPAGGTATPHGAAWGGLLHDGSVLLLGEDDPSATGSAEVWSAFSQPIVSAPDPAKAAAQAFTAVNTSTVLRVGHTATLLGDGRVLVAGGRDAADPNGPVLRSAEIVDPATGRATAVGDMAVPRADHVAVLLRDGRVLLTGGEDLPCENRDCPGTASAEIFDPGSRQFTTVAPAIGIPRRSSRQGAAAAIELASGRVLILTASQGGGHPAVVLDPSTGDRTPAEWAPCQLGVSLVRLPDDRIFVQCGGQGGACVYDAEPATCSPVDRSEAWEAAAPLGNGRVLLLRQTGEAAVFDPADSTFAKTGGMTARDLPAEAEFWDPPARQLTVLNDGRILVTGGIDRGPAGGQLSTAEIYDPATGTFSSVGPMIEARSQHTTTVLDDGRVLIIGGVRHSPDRTDPEPITIERFDPGRF